ncbi:hypothetical protein [Naasia aerilata]|uniref:Uncharacterized protein n=1 Tax=Naasia aerilata TaxID=1162966 RepID=A0ABM8G8R1_9MICO|nr:hypothetical protein [Naasia aerilata]BDZ44569.1 hypothetical protein GCM10025866_04780 [Naasia aerilata]
MAGDYPDLMLRSWLFGLVFAVPMGAHAGLLSILAGAGSYWAISRLLPRSRLMPALIAAVITLAAAVALSSVLYLSAAYFVTAVAMALIGCAAGFAMVRRATAGRAPLVQPS